MEEPEGDQKRSVKERGTEAVAKARARAEELLSQAEANRPRSRLIDIAFGSYERDAEVGGGILAGAVAFRVFLFIVPFVFFLVVAFGLVADAVGASVTTVTHRAGIAGLLATTIRNVGDQSVWGCARSECEQPVGVPTPWCASAPRTSTPGREQAGRPPKVRP